MESRDSNCIETTTEKKEQMSLLKYGYYIKDILNRKVSKQGVSTLLYLPLIPSLSLLIIFK